MNILIITPWFPTEENPASGAFVLEQARALSKMHNVFVLAPRLYEKGKSPKIKASEIDGVEYLMPGYSTFPKLGIPLYVMAVIKHYFKIRKKFKPDIIHAHVTLLAGFAAVVLGKMTGIPVVITEHSSYIRKQCERFISRSALIYTLKHADLFIAVSKVLADTLKKFHSPGKMYVIPNIVDLTVFNYNADNDGIYNKMIFVGLLDGERKNLDHLLKAFKKVVEQIDKDFYIDIIGEGKLKLGYEQLAEELEVKKYCTFLGKKEKLSDVAEAMRKSDFLVLPSSYENFGVVLIEAMALGKPVIATKCGGPEEIVKDFNGILVDVGDIDGLSKAIVHMINNISEYDHRKIVEHVRNNYSAEGIASKLTSLYEALLKKK